MRIRNVRGLRALVMLCVISRAAILYAGIAVEIVPLNSSEGISWVSGEPQYVRKGENGTIVARFDGGFAGGINPSERGVDFANYDLMAFRIKADRGAFLVFSLENYPKAGKTSKWYVLDGLRGPFDWKTIWIDLRHPEEYKNKVSSTEVSLNIHGFHKDIGRAMQGTDRKMYIGAIRAVKKTVDIDWDQISFEISQQNDLTYRYPLTVTNRHTESITVSLRAVPIDVVFASASFSLQQVSLGAGESRTVYAEISLPADIAAAADPLYAERFRIEARDEGIDHSDVTILRSSDPIHLTVTVPVPENKLTFPLLPRPSKLPSSLIFFDESVARTNATAASTSQLIQDAMDKGIYNYSSGYDASSFRKSLISAAYLHDKTGEQKYFTIASELLAALPAIWKKFYAEYESDPNRLISWGIIVRMGEGFHYTLGLGWRLMGTQRSPYQYSKDHNSSGGGMSSIFYAFDIVADKLDPTVRQKIIDGFIVPAGIQCRNHYIGDGNQQATANVSALYAGLVSKNWPLVSFAYSSEHSLRNIIEWTFTDQGVHIRDNYQDYTLRPIFWAGELLYHRGVNVYLPYKSRLEAATGDPEFHDDYFWNYIVNNRMEKTGQIAAPTNLSATSGAGSIVLRWEDNADNEAMYKVERRAEGSNGFSEIAVLPEHALGYIDREEPGTQWHYRVRAFNYDAGSSSYSNVAWAQAEEKDTAQVSTNALLHTDAVSIVFTDSYIRVTRNKPARVDLSVTDLMGRNLFTRSFTHPGTGSISIPMIQGKAATGSYIVRARSGTQEVVRRIVRIR